MLLGQLYPAPVCFPVLKAPHFFFSLVAVCSVFSFSPFLFSSSSRPPSSPSLPHLKKPQGKRLVKMPVYKESDLLSLQEPAEPIQCQR